MKKQRLRQITIKLSERQITALKQIAEEKGDQPLAVVIREAVHQYLKYHGKLK